MGFFNRAHWLEAKMNPVLWHRLQRAWAWVAFLVFVAASCVYFFQQPFLYYPKGNVFAPSEITVERGKSISLVVPRCNRSSDKKSYHLSRELVRLDKVQPHYSILSSDVIIEGNTCDVLYKEYRIPDNDPNLPPGIYRVEGDAIVEGFWGRKFIIRFMSAPFTVL